MANENPTWGYTRIRGGLMNLGHDLARNTIKEILKDHGIAPAPCADSSLLGVDLGTPQSLKPRIRDRILAEAVRVV